MRQTAAGVVRRVRAMGNPKRAVFSQRFFKTGPGQYGEGDRFLGLTVPQIRNVSREVRDLPLAEVEKLLESPWHEVRLLAVVLLANAYRQANAATRARIYRLYL